MIDTYFLDRDGTPLAGKIPLQVRFAGGGDFDAVRAEANGLLQHFIHQARQSLADTHRIRYALPGKGEMLVTSIFGVVTVDILLPAAPPDEGPFYGGILINPHVITGNEADYLSLAGNPTPWAVPEAIKSAGDAPGLPAVPGTGDASTEWLVVQIARNMPLTGDPIGSGAVRIYRIADPKFGVFCEVAEPGRYAVSTIDGSAFFLCGQQLDHVPPMPGGIPAIGRSLEAGGGPSPSRIRTLGMTPSSFINAHAAEGIIIFALVNQLWALNTRERTDSTPAPWRLLAEVSTPRAYPGDYLPNEFGTTFTVASEDGEMVLTCSGTNGLGACSGFEVRIDSGDITGTLSLVDSGFRASVAHSQTVSFTGDYSRPRTQLVDAFPFYELDSAAVDWTVYHNRHVAYASLGIDETHSLDVIVEGPVPAVVFDSLLGGLMPRRAERYTRVFHESGSVLAEALSYDFRLKGSMRNQRHQTSSTTETIEPSAAGVGYQSATGSYNYDSSPGLPNFPSEDLWLNIPDYLEYYAAAYYSQATFSIDFNFDPSWADGRDGAVWDYPGEVIGTNWALGLARYRRLGDLYVNTREIQGRVKRGTSLIYVPTPYAYASARYFIDFDPLNRLQFQGVPPFDKATPIPKEVWTDAPFDGFVLPDETELDRWSHHWAPDNFEGEVISRYPKRAAKFAVTENFSVQDTYTGSLLGRSFSTNKTRTGGQLVANEYLAHLLPTNVGDYVEPEKPTATVIENRQEEAGSDYERDPYLRYAYTARDWHCDTMGWRRDAGRTGSWFIEDRPLLRFANNGECALLHETADRVEASHTLYRAGGATVMTFPDLMSFYPLRSVHGSISFTTTIQNVAAPYLQHDLTYLDKRFPELDDCDSVGIPQTGGLGGTAYNLDEGDTFFFDTECLPRREWMPKGPYRAGWTPNRPQLLVAYWGRDSDGGARDPLFPVPGYWIPNPEEDPPEGEEYIHVPHITEASETDYDLTRPELGFTPDFTGGILLGAPRGAEFYELQARNFLGDMGQSFDALYVDNRTGGFLTHVFWKGSGGRIVETYIGNRTGVVPFRPILDAWLARGGGTAEGTKVILDRPSVLADGPAPAPDAINPQLVSLL